MIRNRSIPSHNPQRVGRVHHAMPTKQKQFILLFRLSQYHALFYKDFIVRLDTINRDHSFLRNTEFWAVLRNHPFLRNVVEFGTGRWQWDKYGIFSSGSGGRRNLFPTCRQHCAIKHMTAKYSPCLKYWQFIW